MEEAYSENVKVKFSLQLAENFNIGISLADKSIRTEGSDVESCDKESGEF